MENTSFFIKLKLSTPLSINDYSSFINSLKTHINSRVRTYITFFLEEDIQVFGKDLSKHVPIDYLTAELSDPKATISFDETGEYDLLLKKFEKAQMSFPAKEFPINNIISVFITKDSINTNTNWFEIPD